MNYDTDTYTTDDPNAPQIHPPFILGSYPESPFLYGVPVTGPAPYIFSAENLPEGLTIASDTGIITGTTPAEGSYPLKVIVSNNSGSTKATLTLVSGATLALTPPMGWNSYDSFYANVKESDVLAAAQAMKTYLHPYGWNTVVIDYLWYDSEQVVDANGRWLPSPSKYPNANGDLGFKPLADQIHAMGLKFGIHIMRGIPRKSVSQNLPIANSSFRASDAANTNDACAWDQHMWGVRADTEAGKAWYDSIFAQYAEWGVDFIKMDDMMNPYGGNAYHGREVEAAYNAIKKTGRSIILSLSPGPNQTRDTASLNSYANMWRTVNDFWDTNGLSTIDDEFNTAYSWSQTDGITQGHWPDADMLPLGTIGNRPCAFTHDEQRTVMSLWAMMPSPLMFGGMPIRLNNDQWTIDLLTNEDVLAVNQDSLGNRAKRILQQGSSEIWARDLANGGKAVALFNRGNSQTQISVTFSQLGLSGTYSVRDLWNKTDITGITDGISANVPAAGASMFKVTP